MSTPYLEAKMFKIEKCILNYASFKHPWEQLYYYFRAAIFRKTFSSRTPPVSASEDCLNIDYCWEFFNKIFIGKLSSPQNCEEGGEEGGWHPPPLSLCPCILNIIIWTINFILKSITRSVIMLNTMMKIENNFHQSIQHDEASGYNFYNPIFYFLYF